VTIARKDIGFVSADTEVLISSVHESEDASVRCLASFARGPEDFDDRAGGLTPILQLRTRATTRAVLFKLVDSLQKDQERIVAVLIDEAGGGDPSDAVH